MSRPRRIRTEPQAPPALSHADLILAVHGPRHADAQCEATPNPSWHPRARAAYLERLWLDHEAAIVAAATAADVEPWISSRLFFLAALRGEA